MEVFLYYMSSLLHAHAPGQMLQTFPVHLLKPQLQTTLDARDFMEWHAANQISLAFSFCKENRMELNYLYQSFGYSNVIFKTEFLIFSSEAINYTCILYT